MKIIRTFAIETSCDDTSVALVKFDWIRFEVEKMLSYSQTKEHKKYWGVVPEVASRLHEEKILVLLDEFWKENIERADFISVTSEPWLPWSLIVWITAAYSLWKFLNKQIIEVNHIFWHIFSLFLERDIKEIKLPLVVLTASWGHNEIRVLTRISDENNKIRWFNLLSDNFLSILSDISLFRIGHTLDDAAWEAFDKVARMLGWPYPWWPWISKKANFFKENFNDFFDDEILKLINKKIRPIFLSSDKFEFSFSWYKSQVYYVLKELKDRWVELNEEIISLIAYKFQESVVEVLAKKLVQAAIKFWAKTIWITGWVSANDRLFEYLNDLVENKKRKKLIDENIKILRPVKRVYSTDNAAMIGVVGILKRISKNLQNF